MSNILPKIYNNTFYECAVPGDSEHVIHLDNVNSPDIRNNIIYTSTTNNAIGIFATNITGTPICDYNDVFGINTLYSGITPGINSLNVNPQMIDPDNFNYLLMRGPCRNSGVDVGLTIDAAGITRPQESEYDIGAFEYVFSTMTFFVNALGSATYPFDTPAKGATSISNLLSSISQEDGDIYELTDDAEIDNSTTTISIRKSITIRSYSGNTENAVVKLQNAGLGINISSDPTIDTIKFQNIKFYKPGPNAVAAFFIKGGTSTNALNNLEISGCECYVVDTTNNNSYFFEGNGGAANSFINSVIRDNLIHDLDKGISITSGSINLTIKNNTIYNITNSAITTAGSSNDDCTIEGNIIYDFNTGISMNASDNSNYNIKNNVFYDGVSAIVQSNAIITSGSIVNNSIRNMSAAAVILPIGATNCIIANNIIHGNGNTTPIGFDLNEIIAANCILDYNNVFECITAYNLTGTGGHITVEGPNSIAIDPSFKDIDDLNLDLISPCIDSGVGNATYAAIPTSDINNVARPNSHPDHIDVTDGTDIGAYEIISNWVITYPKLGTVNETAQFLVQTNIDSTAYFVVVPDNDPAPSMSQIKAGQDSTGSSVPEGFSGNVSLTANVENELLAFNLMNLTPYDVYIVAEDGGSIFIQGSPIKLDFTTLDLTEPSWNTTYPKTGTIGGTNAQFLVEINENGNAYFVVVPNGDPVPTSQQVKDGQDSTGAPVAAGFSGSVTLVQDVENSFAASNLMSETNYDVYLVAEDTSSNLQASPATINFTTSDVTMPEWVTSYPKYETAEHELNFLLNLSENGVGYVVVLPKYAAPPTSQQVKDGRDSTNTPVPVGFSGNTTLTVGSEAIITTTNQFAGTDYDAYIVAEDSSGNLQTSPVKLEVTTLSKITRQKTIPASEVGALVTIRLTDLAVDTSKLYPGSFLILVNPIVETNQYEFVDSASQSLRVKILGDPNKISRIIKVAVNDGVHTSDIFDFKVTVTMPRKKSKPVGYSIQPSDTGTRRF